MCFTGAEPLVAAELAGAELAGPILFDALPAAVEFGGLTPGLSGTAALFDAAAGLPAINAASFAAGNNLFDTLRSAWNGVSDFMGDWSQPLSMASQLGSVYARNQAMNQQAEALSDAQRAEMDRQDAFTQQGLDRLHQTMQFMAPEQARQILDEQTERRTQRLTPDTAAPDAGEYAQVSPSTPAEVRGDIANGLVRAIEKGKQYAKGLAKVGAPGMLNFEQGLTLADSAGDLTRLNNASQGSMNIFQGFDLPAARARGANSGWATASDVLGGLGDIGMMYSLTRPGKTPAVRQATAAERTEIQPYINAHRGFGY